MSSEMNRDTVPETGRPETLGEAIELFQQNHSACAGTAAVL